MLFFIASGFLVLLFIVLKTFRVVPQQTVFVRERLGSYKGNMLAGFHFMIPFIDRVAYRHTLKEEVIDVPPQICITKDNVQVEVDGVLYIKVMDPYKASYGINDYRFASIQLAQTNMRSEIGRLDLDHTFVERETINDNVVKALDLASEPWGVKVTRYEIKNIVPPASVIHTMEQQMRAEREKRAEIAHSEGERTALVNLSESEKIEAINLSEGEKMRTINEADGKAKAIELVAEATADALKLVAHSLTVPGGNDAMKLRVAGEFIKRFGNVLESAETSVVPVGLAKIMGTFQGLGELLGAGGDTIARQSGEVPGGPK